MRVASDGACAGLRQAWVVADGDAHVRDLLTELEVLGFATRRVSIATIATPPGVPAVALVVGSGTEAGAYARRACSALRVQEPLRHVPIVVVMPVGRIPIADVALGAHELVVRPLRPGELESRIDRALAASPRAAPDLSLRAGVLQLDPGSRTVRIDGTPVAFSARQFELLVYLMRHPARVHSRAQLLRVVWRGDAGVGTRAVDVQVRRVRAKLGDELGGCIRTVRRVGYSFTLPS